MRYLCVLSPALSSMCIASLPLNSRRIWPPSCLWSARRRLVDVPFLRWKNRSQYDYNPIQDTLPLLFSIGATLSTLIPSWNCFIFSWNVFFRFEGILCINGKCNESWPFFWRIILVNRLSITDLRVEMLRRNVKSWSQVIKTPTNS